VASTDVRPASVWFSTVEPPYLDKGSAPLLHGALQLPRTVGTYDAHGSVRSALGALRAGLGSGAPALVVAAGLRNGLPGSADEANGGDGAAALLVGEGRTQADLVAWASASEEALDRWRTPGDIRSKLWEDRFGELRHVELAIDAWAATGLDAASVDHLVVVGAHRRANTSAATKLGVPADRMRSDLAGTVGNTGAAHPALALASVLEVARPGQLVALVVLADGADVAVFRTTDALAADAAPTPSVAVQVERSAAVSYPRYLAWRGLLPVEPPRRPEPARPSSSAAARNAAWKLGFVGSDDGSGGVRLPPAPGEAGRRPMSGVSGTVATFTIDRLAYSPSPPIVFAVVDFDGGGRLPIELTDVDPAEVRIGMRVEMTFRRLFTADGIHNYFWKGTPSR
jgi:hypothetical protein